MFENGSNIIFFCVVIVFIWDDVCGVIGYEDYTEVIRIVVIYFVIEDNDVIF